MSVSVVSQPARMKKDCSKHCLVNGNPSTAELFVYTLSQLF